jgi:hypothetical protein
MLKQLNSHFEPQTAAAKTTARKMPRMKPTLDVWDSMGLDKHMSPFAIEKRNAVKKLMEEIQPDLIPHLNDESMPHWVIPKI